MVAGVGVSRACPHLALRLQPNHPFFCVCLCLSPQAPQAWSPGTSSVPLVPFQPHLVPFWMVGLADGNPRAGPHFLPARMLVCCFDFSVKKSICVY